MLDIHNVVRELKAYQRFMMPPEGENMYRLMSFRVLIFWCSYFIYLIATVFQTTMYNYNSDLFRVFVTLRYISFAGAGIKIVLDLLEQYLKDRKEGQQFFKWDYDSVLCAVKYFVIFGLLFIVSMIADERSLLFVFAFLLASKGISENKIFQYTFYVQVALSIFVVFCSSVGLLPDLLFERGGNYIRHALGYIYPSVAFNYFFFIIVLKFWSQKKRIELKEAFLLELINFLLFLLTDVRTGFLVVSLIILIEVINEKKHILHADSIFIKKIQSYKRISSVLSNIYDYFAVYLVLILVVLCSTIQYRPTQIINTLLTSRIQLVVDAVKKYGIHWFGNNIEWIGFGGNPDANSFEGIYNFIDCSYASIILNYGIVVFVGIMVLLVLVGKDLRKKRHYDKCFLYFVVLAYCFIEPRLIELQANTLLFLMAPLMYSRPPRVKKYKKKDGIFYKKAIRLRDRRKI